MKISARNRLKGLIVEVRKGATTAHVRLDIGGAIVTSSITNEAVDELKLANGHDRLRGHQGFRRDDRDRGRSRLMRSSLLVLAASLIALPASAAEPSGCDKFAWPLEKERKLLGEPKAVPASDALDRNSGQAVRLELQPWPDAKLPARPEREPKKMPSWAGFARFAGASGVGRYKISLSEGAWIDVVQDANALKPLAFTGATDCSNIRKSVKFELGPGPFTLQLSDAPSPEIAIVITPGE